MSMLIAGDNLGMDVSRETEEMLTVYSQMLQKWNPSINLIAQSTVKDLYERHFLDSLQIIARSDLPLGLWADLGSGGGLPGIVVAIDAKTKSLDRPIVLVEADQRKSTFLREVVRVLGLNVTVIAKRIENVSPLSARVVSARALASLEQLCSFSVRHLVTGGVAVFPKGANRGSEVYDARVRWKFDLVEIPSVTNPEAAILYLRDLRHA